MSPPKPRRSLLHALAALLVLLLAVPACAAGAGDTFRPLGTSGTGHRFDNRSGATGEPAPTSGVAPSPSTPRTSPAGPTGGADTTAPGDRSTGTGSDAAIVALVLDAYDRTLMTLLADPTALLGDDDPRVAAWLATMSPGAVLADDVRAVVAGRAAAGQRVDPPPGTDRSYVHRAVRIDPAPPSSETSADVVRFTWCGWSPGIVTDVASGAVVDDTVAHVGGTGRVRRIDGAWRLDSLDQDSIEVLTPGSGDPCPAPMVPPDRSGR